MAAADFNDTKKIRVFLNLNLSSPSWFTLYTDKDVQYDSA
jgi:hypothetical protein